jgi:hypothetical protein
MEGEITETVLLPGRKCGACSLCCKLLRIDAFQKPEGRWCNHCAPGKGGCKIYQDRPTECRKFYCAWLTATDVGPEWFPLKSKMVLYAEGDGNRIALHVDPATPNSWREAPYYQQLRDWTIIAAEQSQQVIIYITDRVIALLPNKEVDLGINAAGRSYRRSYEDGTRWQGLACLYRSRKGRATRRCQEMGAVEEAYRNRRLALVEHHWPIAGQ